tara:strand:- start:3721 stop:4053 length:333 start_codon:yes stop_codon:yes gene_type:complete
MTVLLLWWIYVLSPVNLEVDLVAVVPVRSAWVTKSVSAVHASKMCAAPCAATVVIALVVRFAPSNLLPWMSKRLVWPRCVCLLKGGLFRVGGKLDRRADNRPIAEAPAVS